MKNYPAIEIGAVALLTAILMGMPSLGGIWPVVPLIALGWATLQLGLGRRLVQGHPQGRCHRLPRPARRSGNLWVFPGPPSPAGWSSATYGSTSSFPSPRAEFRPPPPNSRPTARAADGLLKNGRAALADAKKGICVTAPTPPP